MPGGIKIAPSILSADFARLGEEVSAAVRAGADAIHVDVMDGHFVPNLTIGPPVVRAVSRVLRDHPGIVVDTHLMIEKPERYIDAFIEAGSHTVGVHVETCPHLHRTIQQIRQAGAKACVALNPGTPAAMIEPVLAEVQQVLVMSVNPGFGGQSFIRSSLAKIREIRGMILERGLEIDIEVDGGINSSTVAEVHQAGANVLVAGSALFGQPDYAGVIGALRDACRTPQPR